MRTSTKAVLWFITCLTVHPGMALLSAATLETVREPAQPRLCFLSPQKTLLFPSSLSAVQHGYLSELCDKVLRFHNRLTAANPMEQPSRIGSPDFEWAKSLYELDRQHVANMSQLIEQAVAQEPFPEASFWKAWIDERNTYRDASHPLIERQAEYIVEQLQ